MKIVNGTKRKAKTRIMSRDIAMTRREYEALQSESRRALIGQLIPLGMMAAGEALQREVEEVVGAKYSHQGNERKAYRHGTNPGSVRLAGHRVGIDVPRVRSGDGEVALCSYQVLHEGRDFDAQLFRQMLHGISTHNYESASRQVPGAIGLSSSSVSKRLIDVSSKVLKDFHERDLSKHDIVAIFLDGKAFAETNMVIALGITMQGKKVFLGFVETDTENKVALTAFLRELLRRGLDISKGVLCIIDGSKGLSSACKKAFKGRVLIQRCQWHKRENVVSYLSKEEQTWMRKRLQHAYGRSTHKEASEALEKILAELEERNQSAAASLVEGLSETLTLHELGVFASMGKSFKTTNCIESVNAMAEEICGRVDYWKNSSQRQRWLAAALIDIEPRLRTVMGYKHLPKLRNAIMKTLKINTQQQGQNQPLAA